MKTNKKSFRKAALPAFGVLAAAVMSLTSVTYAWFTSGNEATVDTINVGVESAGGLQISMGGNGTFQWSSSVTPELDVQTLVPVSTTGQLNQGELVFYTATYNDTLDKIHSINTVTDASKSYVTFDLYFRNPEGQAKEIQINNSKIKSTSGSSHQATRLAFVTQGTISSLASDQSAASFIGKYCLDEKAQIYEPHATDHTEDAINDVKDKYVENDDGSYDYLAIAKQSTDATTYFDRYTGEKYTTVTRGENFPEDDTTYYIMSNGVSVWSEDSDYNAMTQNQVYDFLQKDENVNTKFYIKNLVSGEGPTAQYEYREIPVMKEVPNEATPEPDDMKKIIDEAVITAYSTFYTYNEVTVYEKTTGDVLESVETTKDATATFIRLEPQTVTKVTVYIWIEGQDADCTNAVAGYAFDVELKFSIK